MMSNSPINDNTWHHIAVTKNGATLSLYLDGRLQDTETDLLIGNTDDNNSMSFGVRQVGGLNDYFKGAIDEVRFWSEGKSQEEIFENIGGPLTGSEENLLRYFDFNQGTAGGDNTTITRVFNYDGPLGRHGFLENFTLLGPTSNFIGGTDFEFVPIPTLGQWGMIFLFISIAIFGVLWMREKRMSSIKMF